METPITDFLTPDAILRNVGFFLLVLALAMPTLFLVRIFALVAGLVVVVVAVVGGSELMGLFWGTLIVVVVLAQLALSMRRRFADPLNAEEQVFHDRVVPGLDRSQTRRLLTAGQWRDVAAGTALTREGEATPELCFVARGTVDIMVGGRKVADVGVGELIGEVGLSTGDPATATAVCATPVRYLGFPAADLYGVLDGNVELQDAVELAIQRSLRAKLHAANAARAQAGG
ncbi:MAG TPA: cyclic nucleotide-binding domain-containing protein [Bauldia sp.]|nr:cyclic nucleotide-binding domain-containing protein [Bauldia sp.]